MSITIELAGAKELERALSELADQPAMRRAIRKALRDAAQPMLEAAKEAVPVDRGDLKRSLKIATAKKVRGGDQDSFGIVIGIDANEQPARYIVRKTVARKKMRRRVANSGTYRDPGVAGVGPIVEFGRPGQPPEPFMRPAFDVHGPGAIARFGAAAGPAIEAEAARLARRKV